MISSQCNIFPFLDEKLQTLRIIKERIASFSLPENSNTVEQNFVAFLNQALAQADWFTISLVSW